MAITGASLIEIFIKIITQIIYLDYILPLFYNLKQDKTQILKFVILQISVSKRLIKTQQANLIKTNKYFIHCVRYFTNFQKTTTFFFYIGNS